MVGWPLLLNGRMSSTKTFIASGSLLSQKLPSAGAPVESSPIVVGDNDSATFFFKVSPDSKGSAFSATLLGKASADSDFHIVAEYDSEETLGDPLFRVVQRIKRTDIPSEGTVNLTWKVDVQAFHTVKLSVKETGRKARPLTLAVEAVLVKN